MTNATGYREYHIKMYQNQKAEDLSTAIKDKCASISGSNVNRVKLSDSGDTKAELLALINSVLTLSETDEETAMHSIRVACNEALARI
jgi:hypothetical protein